MEKIFITGGSGLLGSNLIDELNQRRINYYAPNSTECNIVNYNSLEMSISKYNPTILIHCAAIAKFALVEDNPINGIDVNVLGTFNVVKLCMKYNIRLIFISTSHIFDGTKGMYDITDKINPLTKYAKTKAAGEYISSIHDNHLIIRTEFCEKEFPFKIAYTDKWSSKEYVDVLVPKIIDVSISGKIGICHLGGTRKSFYEFGLERNPNVMPGSVQEIIATSKVPILIDTSLKISDI